MTLDEELVEAIRRDYRTAPIEERDRVMLDYVAELTRDATRITPEHHARLRAVGFDDRGILQITLIASWFNYINRVADALGVGRGRNFLGQWKALATSVAICALLTAPDGQKSGGLVRQPLVTRSSASCSIQFENGPGHGTSPKSPPQGGGWNPVPCSIFRRNTAICWRTTVASGQ